MCMVLSKAVNELKRTSRIDLGGEREGGGGGGVSYCGSFSD